MKIASLLFAASLALPALAQAPSASDSLNTRRVLCDIALEQPLFKTFPKQTPYRIPAIAATQSGSLIALTDYRPCGADIGYGRVDLRYRISYNNGATWSPELVLVQGDGVAGSPTCGYGDAAVVADSRSGEVIVVCVTGNTVYGAATTTRENPNRVAILRSTDNGRTWSEPEDITESIYSLFDKSTLGPVQSLFFGSGRICQSRQVRFGRYHRLYAALCARPGGNRVVYSDDFGRSWHALGSIDSSPAPKGDEPKVEELPNGNVVLSSRIWGGRYFNIFSYISQRNATGTWAEAVASAEAKHGIVAQQNACNGEILVVDAIDQKTKRVIPVVLQSVPLGPGRSRVGIYYKPLYSPYDYQTPALFATHWRGPYEVTPMLSAYSTMILQPDGRIGFFYEEATYGAEAAYTEMYRPICLGQITNGEFRTLEESKR